MKKSKKVRVIKNIDCLNCGFPFSGHEVFCPECGQKNKGKKITLSNFLSEIFKGFTSWDTKFWRTLFPLLIAPGKVSRDYIEGKRARYTNPFRFYITTSIIFFLLLGARKTQKRYNEFNSRNNTVINSIASDEIDRDSLQSTIYKELDKTQRKKDSLKNLLIKTDSIQKVKDSTSLKNELDSFKLAFADTDDILPFIQFQKKHPNLSVDKALDSLHVEKNFSNRFWYSRSKIINSFISDKDENKKFANYIVSHISIALLFLLPLLAFCLKVFYFRRKFNYVDHLIFTFHVQTVFFILSTVFIIISFFQSLDSDRVMMIFSILFLIYLYIAMKTFYKQGWFKTLFKFLMTNFIFMILFVLGAVMVSAIGFIMY